LLYLIPKTSITMIVRITTIALLAAILLPACKKQSIQQETDSSSAKPPAFVLPNGAATQLLEIGGSNYSLFDVQQYLNNPTEATWYTPGVMNLVVGHYHLDPVKVNTQLQDMYNKGQRKLAIMIWYSRLLPGITAPTWGHLIKSDGGRMTEQHEQNLAAVLNKISQIGYNEVMLRFATQGTSDPGGWTAWNEPLFQENWNFVYNAVHLSETVLGNTAVRRTYDLGVELGGLTGGQTVPYIKKLWSNYVFAFGNVRSYGFSIAHAPGRLARLISDLRTTGNLPGEYAADIYGNEGGAINTIAAELQQAGELAKPLVVQECYYNDATAFSELLNTSLQRGVKLRCMMQWPIQRGSAIPHFSMNYPPVYSEYGKPYISAAGSGCTDLYCIWITGQNFDPVNSYVNIHHPATWALLNTYSGADIARYTSNGQWVITLRLKTAAEMNLFATSGLRVFVVNPTYPQWADGRLVNR
jgi:hypothetical protein